MDENKKKKNSLGIVGFVISIAMVLFMPIIAFILGDINKHSGASRDLLILDYIMLFEMIPLVICWIASKRSPKGFARAGLIISAVTIAIVLILRFVARISI